MNAGTVEFRGLFECFGVEALDVDLRRPLDEAAKRRLRATLHRQGLVLFRDQDLSDEECDRAATIFGEISYDGNYSQYVSNVEREGRLVADGELLFHMDLSFAEAPLRGLMLYGCEVPPADAGGETLFADVQRAYELLPPGLRERIDMLKIVHSTSAIKDHVRIKVERTSSHPIAYPHPVTGKLVLFCSPRHFLGVEGLSPDEGAALCDEITGYMRRPEIIYTHRWRRGDLLVWDNIRLQHARNSFDPRYRRHLRRTQIDLAAG